MPICRDIPRLEDNLIILRKIKLKDLWSLHKNLNDRAVRQFMPSEYCGPSRGKQGYRLHRFSVLFRYVVKVLQIFSAHFSRREWTRYRFAVISKRTNKAVGVLTLGGINYSKKHATVGILLGKDYWGQGIMLAAESLVFQWAFDILGLECLFADVSCENVASYVTMKKLGFQRQDTPPSNANNRFIDGRGREVEMVRMILRSEDFRKTKIH